MEWLRWILLAVGVVTLIGIIVVYFRHRSEQAVVLGQGPGQDRVDPIDAQLRAGHTIGGGPAQSADASGEREDPFIDGVGKARVVRPGFAEPEPPLERQDEEAVKEAGSAGPSSPSLFRQRQDADMNSAAMASADEADSSAEESAFQADLFAERSEAPLGVSTDDLMHDVLHEEDTETVEDEEGTSEPDQPVVLSLLLAQRQREAFDGLQLQQLIEEIGFRFGDFSIYHFNGEDDAPWFSLMNGLQPGTFDPQDVDSFSTPVLALFMQLPIPGGAQGELVFERMLEVARDMADQLDAELLDDHREPISADSIDRYREQLIFF